MIALQMLPLFPGWTEIHPLVIHFPVALLLVAPLFVVAGVIVKPHNGRPFLIAALLLMLLGTAGALLAVATGEAAGKAIEHTSAVSPVFERHKDLAEMTRVVFSGLTLIFAAILFLPRLLKREETVVVARIIPLAFLLLYSAGVVILVNASHNGARLVHEFGVHPGVAQSHGLSGTSSSVHVIAQETERNH